MKSLKRLSDARLLNRLHELVHQEHDLTCEILLHSIEVEDRGIYRSLGHGSMYAYCTDRLGYAESSAQRRICAARAIRKCPRAYDYLVRGEVNLGTLSLIAAHITPELLDEIRGESYRKVQGIVSRFNPMVKHRDVTRPVAIRRATETAESQPADSVYNRDGGRCTYVGSDGNRCNSTWDLEIHHDGKPYAHGASMI